MADIQHYSHDAGWKHTILRGLLYLVLILFAAYYLFPLFVMISTSLKSLDEIREGSPSMNFINATLINDNGNLAVSIKRDKDPIILPLKDAPESYQSYVGKDVVFGIRPEGLTHKRTGSGEPGSQYVNFDCKVEVIEPTCADTMTVVEIGGKEIVARVRPDRAPQPGEMMTFSADMSQISLFDPVTELRI